MKNKLQLFILVTLLCLSNGFAQITLDKTIPEGNAIHFTKIEDDVKYFIFNTTDLILTIYNADHSIYKTITINQAELGFTYNANDVYFSEYFPIACLSTNVFNTDNNLEFILLLYTDTITNTYIVNEDGSILQTFTDKRPAYRIEYNSQTPTWIKNTNTGLKMILRHKNSTSERYLYSLPGTATLSTQQEVTNNSSSFNAFPNPAENYTNLRYKLPNNITKGNLQIYNIRGSLVKEYKVDNHVDFLNISTNELSSGTYLYRVIGNNFKSKTSKFIIK